MIELSQLPDDAMSQDTNMHTHTNTDTEAETDRHVYVTSTLACHAHCLRELTRHVSVFVSDAARRLLDERDQQDDARQSTGGEPTLVKVSHREAC